VEDPFGADADQHLGAGLGQAGAESDRVIAGVEDEQGASSSSGRATTTRLTWSMVAVVASMHGLMRMASSGAVHESGAQSSWEIHWKDQPATMGCPAECFDAE